LNWLRGQDQQIIPILGARKLEQIEDCLGCLRFELPNEMMQELNELSAVDLGFPHDFLAYPTVQEVLFGDNVKKIINHHV